MREILKNSFKITIPILAGYLVLGLGYGILFAKAGYNPIFATLSAIFIFGGSAQYTSVGLLVSNETLLNVFIVIFVIDIRHIFYGISLLKKYSGLGKAKVLPILQLTDETFSLIVARNFEERNKKKYIFTISILNHIYWIIGCSIGAFLYKYITFSTKGIEFVLTALFVTILIDQLTHIKNKILPFIGIISTILAIIIFKDQMIIISFILIISSLFIFRKPFEKMEGGMEVEYND